MTSCRSWRTSPAAGACRRTGWPQVAEHYYRFGGVSPINQQCRDLLAAIGKDFAAAGVDLPVYWGNRNWRPYLADTVARDGRRRGAPRARVRDLRLQLLLQLPAVPGRHRAGPGRRPAPAHRGSTRSGTSSTTRASSSRSPRPPCRAVRSLPAAVSEQVPAGVHRAQHPGGDGGGQRPAGRRPVPGPAGRRRPGWSRTGPARPPAERPWRLAYQSRSGPPSASPGSARTSCDHLTELAAAGAPGVVLVPVGFVSDHMEVVLRPGRGGGADGRAARPAAGPGGHPGHRPAVRRDDHRAGHRAAGRLGAAAALGSSASGRRPDFCRPGCCRPPRRPPGRRRAARRAGRVSASRPTRRRRCSTLARSAAEAAAGCWPAAGRPARPGGRGGGHQVQPDRRGDRDGPGRGGPDHGADQGRAARRRDPRRGGRRVGGQGRVRWIVDPLDGTVNYLYGLADWAVSIAAEVAGQVVAGVVSVPAAR